VPIPILDTTEIFGRSMKARPSRVLDVCGQAAKFHGEVLGQEMVRVYRRTWCEIIHECIKHPEEEERSVSVASGSGSKLNGFDRTRRPGLGPSSAMELVHES
jgi:hypothetical protein